MIDLIEKTVNMLSRRMDIYKVDIYIDGAIYQRAAEVSELFTILKAKNREGNLQDVKISVAYSEIDIITKHQLEQSAKQTIPISLKDGTP
jgi:hypothetical protein